MMKRFTVVFAVCALVFALVAGCSKKEAANPAATAPQGMQPAAAMAPAPANEGLSGKVVETMNAGGYTYVLIENSGKQTWVAGPMTTVKVGQQVTCQPGAEMKNFTSPS